MTRTIINKWDDIEWKKNEAHIELYQKELLSAADADSVNIKASSVLFEKIGYNGAVIPHYHDVCEVICITKGVVNLLCDGKWSEYKEGDTFIVPAKAVHSVANLNPEVDSEQISFFIPVSEEKVSNQWFNTHIVDEPSIDEVIRNVR